MGKLTKQGLKIPTPMDDLREEYDKKKEILEQEARNILEPILDEYGYIDEERRGKTLAIMVREYVMGVGLGLYEGDIFELQDNLEVAKLIRILRQCEEVVVTGVIEYPQNDKEIKTQTTKTAIRSNFVFLMLEYFLNTLLEYQQDGFYQYKFKWDDKDYLSDEDISIKNMNFTEPYTPDELEQIIEYETRIHRIFAKRMTTKQNIGSKISYVKYMMHEQGLFSTDSQGKTREYAFLFDCFVAMDRIPVPEDDMNNSEKYIYIKDCIKTYRNYIKTRRNLKDEIRKIN